MVQADASTQNFGYRERESSSEVTVTNSIQEGPVTRASLREYAAVQRERYLRATRAEKRQLLDEIVAVAGARQPFACFSISLLGRPQDAKAVS